MATLSPTVLRRIWRGLMRGILLSWPGLKEDLYNAVVAADQWLDTNASAYNTALPQPFRGTATAAQKALLLAAVTLARFDGNYLKNLLEDD